MSRLPTFVSWGAAALVVACATKRDSRLPYNGAGGMTAAATAGSTGSESPDADTAAAETSTGVAVPPADSSGGPSSNDGPSATTGDPGSGSSGPGAMASSETGTPSTLCDDVVGSALVPPVVCDGPNGNTTTEIPPNSLYSTSWFGCYFDDDGTIVEDPFDNCEFACGNQGLCPAGQSGPECEANLRWFAADADRYGCGGRIRVTNCANGNAVVLTTLDRGPNCNTVEKACDTPVLDMSHDAMVFLFDGGIYGGCDHETVVVEVVPDDTALGPV